MEQGTGPGPLSPPGGLGMQMDVSLGFPLKINLKTGYTSPAIRARMLQGVVQVLQKGIGKCSCVSLRRYSATRL